MWDGEECCCEVVREFSMVQEGRSCDQLETVREFTYPGDRVSAGGGCEVAVTARTRCGWVMFREHGKFLCV